MKEKRKIEGRRIGPEEGTNEKKKPKEIEGRKSQRKAAWAWAGKRRKKGTNKIKARPVKEKKSQIGLGPKLI